VHPSDLNFTIETLGDCRFASPMSTVRFVDDDERVLYPSTMNQLEAWVEAGRPPASMESAGPRRRLFFDPSKVTWGS